MKIQVQNGNSINEVTITQNQKALDITNGELIRYNMYPYYEKNFVFSYNSNQIETNKILHVSCYPEDFSYPGYIYASFDSNISEDTRVFSSQKLGNNELYIDLSQYPGKNKLYILIKYPRKDNYKYINFSTNLIPRIELTGYNVNARFKLNHINEVIYKVPSPITYNRILIYSQGEDWNFFDMKVQYKTTGGSIRSLPVKIRFETGYGVIADLNMIGEGKEINITLISAYERGKATQFEVGIEFADQEVNYKRKINILEHVYGATDESENCYELAENVGLEKHPVLLINAFTQAISFVVKKTADNTRQYSQDVFHNSYIRLLAPFNNTNYFCIKRFTKKGEEEALGETSYDFQLYYEDDLPDNQMFIMPLINGKIYTHSLNRGSIMVYRHIQFISFSDNIIYSANLLRIRGNPKLYGYTCNTYPDCKVTSDTNGLEEVKIINQYYINKRPNAAGNTELDPNRESVYEIRNQYLSVVICDTDDSDPNHGECKYTIETNTEKEDIQLIPERPFVSSILPGINYFSVKVSNYQDVRKLNISFTVLTGNAKMSVYSDFDLNYIISEYTYHKLFRKEVFEFSSSSIREIYWGVIQCTEPSFIELSYVTDFHYKGFIRTNPGEVNIEYLNKKGSQFPYEIINPYYYHPLNTNLNKNKDFYFKIRSKECSMYYNYNYQNMANTNSVNMKYDRSDQNTYLTSFAFMTTVDNYNYNTNNDLTDCSMIIFSGEIDSSDRPLLIASDIPIPSNFDYTNFIYPFIKNNDFKGIMIDIRFIDNIINPSYSVILSVNNINITDEIIITKDKTIFIEPTNNKIDCGINLQCALQIEIIKRQESDKTYNITVNAYSSNSTVPETIESTEATSKTSIPKDGYKIMQISIGKNEETELSFKFSSGQGKVLAILVNKNQNYDISTIFNEESSNFLNYDSLKGILKITKEESEICDGGCDLIMKIEVENNNKDFSEVSISKNELRKEEKKDDDGNKIESWLAAVITIVCVLVVAGVLVAVYFIFLRKKKKILDNMKTIEESEKDIKGKNDMVSNERVVKFNN